jgi:hypothetical protein
MKKQERDGEGEMGNCSFEEGKREKHLWNTPIHFD